MFKANTERAEGKGGLLCEGGVGEMSSLFGTCLGAHSW